MANYSTLKSAIQEVIKQNGNNEITGNILQQSLLSMVNSLGAGYQFMGVATPSTNPGTPDQNVFYIAATAGTYSNFSSVVLAEGEVAILKGSGSSWTKETTDIVSKATINNLSQQLLDNYFIGNDNYSVFVDIFGLKPGNTYLIIPAQNTFDITGVTISGGNNVFLVQFINQDDTISNSPVAVTKDQLNLNGLADSYQVTIPSDKKGILRFFGRASAGVKVRFCIYDITYIQGISAALFNNSIIGKGNTQSEITIPGLRPGRKYMFVPSKGTWDISGVTGSSTTLMLYLQYQQQDNSFATISGTQTTRGIMLNGGEVQPFIFTFPSNAKELLKVCFRATDGVEERFYIFDITKQQVDNDHLTPTLLDLYGVDSYSFPLVYASHSSTLDHHAINIKAGDVISGTVSLANGAQLDATTRRIDVFLYRSNGTYENTGNITVGSDGTAEFSKQATQDAVAIGFYVTTITKSGDMNVVLRKNGSALQRIAALEAGMDGDTIPEYFDTQVSQVIEDANKDIASIGVDGDNFIFITDIHWEANARKSPALIHNICDRMYLDNVIFGGDAINGMADQNTAREYIAAVASGLRKARSHFAAVFGNHDDNSNNGTAFVNLDQPYYALMQKPNDYRVTEKMNNCYYYFDNPACNTRFIVLNSSTSYSISSTQQNWLRGILTNTPADMHIIIFVHIYLKEVRQTSEGVYIGYDYEISNAGTAINTILADFTDKKIEAIFAGHSHLDANGMTDSMFPVVVSDCDGRNTFMWPNTLGTVNEQSFDVVTIDYTNKVIFCRRVGRGKSRIIHYSTNTLNVNGTLDISSLVSIVPTSYSIRDNFSLQYRNAAGGGTGVTFNGTRASVSNAGVVTAISSGLVVAVAENDDTIETFNIKINA